MSLLKMRIRIQDALPLFISIGNGMLNSLADWGDEDNSRKNKRRGGDE